MNNQRLILFDFDGTITKSDSFLEFLIYSKGFKLFFYAFLALPTLCLYLLKVIPNDTAKEKIYYLFFKGTPKEKFDEMCLNFSREQLPKIIRTDAIKLISKYKEQGEKIFVISASFDNYLRPWCNETGVELLATMLAVDNMRMTGKFATRNCYGAEKVRRLKEDIKLEDFSKIIAYGDSIGDAEMLSIATIKFYKTLSEPTLK